MVKFKYYHTGSTFNSSNLNNDDIAFVEATGSLWTHGHEYKLTDTAGDIQSVVKVNGDAFSNTGDGYIDFIGVNDIQVSQSQTIEQSPQNGTSYINNPGIVFSLKNKLQAVGDWGTSSNTTLSAGDTFYIPYIDVTYTGLLQSAKNVAITIPSQLPASDVYSWAKASTKPSYNLDEISDGSTRKLSDYLKKVTVSDSQSNDFNTFENLTLTGRGDPASGASLLHAPWSNAGPAGGYGTLTYLWSGYGTQMAWGYNDNHIFIRNKYYANNQTLWHEDWDTIALTSDIPSSLPANGGNAATVGGHTVGTDVPANAVFTDTNTWRPLGTGATDACAGNDSRLSDARPASDVYNWAKASTKPSYSYSEISNTPSSLPASDVYTWAKASSKPSYSYSEISGTPSSLPASDVYSWAKASTKPTYTLSEVGATTSVSAISSNTSSTCSITGSGNAGKIQTIIYTNSTSSDLTVTVPTTYTTPDGAAIELTCPSGGYCEISYLNIGGTIYARGV